MKIEMIVSVMQKWSEHVGDLSFDSLEVKMFDEKYPHIRETLSYSDKDFDDLNDCRNYFELLNKKGKINKIKAIKIIDNTNNNDYEEFTLEVFRPDHILIRSKEVKNNHKIIDLSNSVNKE